MINHSKKIKGYKRSMRNKVKKKIRHLIGKLTTLVKEIKSKCQTRERKEREKK